MTRKIPNTTAEERLTALEQFLEFWLGPRRPEYGEENEKLLTLDLPKPLRRFYEFAGRWPPAFPTYCSNCFHAQDRFLPLDPGPWGNIYRSGPYLVFVAENQGVWEVATLPAGDDPNVWISEDCSHRTSSPIWRQLKNPLSHFLVSFVLQECMFGSAFLACHERALVKLSDSNCKIDPIWLNGEYAWPDVSISYYLVNDQVLLRCDSGNVALDDQWYAFNDPAARNHIESAGLPCSVRFQLPHSIRDPKE